MSQRSSTQDGDLRPLHQRVAELEVELRSARDELARLRVSLSAEVRTRRLVIATESGFERIVAEGSHDGGFLRVRGQPHDGRSRVVELFAHDPADEATSVGLALGDGGDIVAVLEVTPDNPPVLWLAPGTPGDRAR